MSSDALSALAAAKGILPEWRDMAGQVQTTRPETQRALLAAMGVAAGNAAEIAEALAEHQRGAAARQLPRELVITAGTEGRVLLPSPTEWRLELESGQTLDGHAEEAIVLDPPAGLHRLSVGDETCLVIVAPAQAPGIAEILGKAHGWGVTAALYGLRSDRNLGLGDYADLAAAASRLARIGADFLGINPVHARGATCAGISPYTPSCRTAFEPRHIAIDKVPGYAESQAARNLLRDNAARLAETRGGDLVDYATSEAIESELLRVLFNDFERRPGEASEEFTRWRKGTGRALEWYALFEAISIDHGDDWRRWPAPLQKSGSPAVRDFAAANAREVRYHAWLQWLADRQLGAAQAAARDAGMALGLYLDVAVGVRPGGGDTWSAQGCFAERASLGAPPDAFNPAGQNWALAPFNPDGLRAAGYRPFIEMLRTTMRHAGIIRIDHVLGLRRSFWVPEDGAPGGYVTYPLEPLLALVRLEAARAGCVVVGEDLGSVPSGLRDSLAEAGLLGCAVMQFEKQDGRFHPPKAYRQATLASFGTHDTPTLRGWWSGWDIDQRHEITKGDDAKHAAAQQERAAERAALTELLVDTGHLPAGIDPGAPPPQADENLVLALHRLLAAGSSVLVAVQLDDALGSVAQQNLPGTIDEHPNWRRRYPVNVDALADVPDLVALAAHLTSSGGHTTRPREVQSCP